MLSEAEIFRGAGVTAADIEAAGARQPTRGKFREGREKRYSAAEYWERYYVSDDDVACR